MRAIHCSHLLFVLLSTLVVSSCQEAGGPVAGSSKKGASSANAVQGEPRYLYAVNNVSETLSVYEVANPGRNQGLRPLSFVLTGKDPVHVSVSPDGSWVVVCNFGSDQVSVYRVDGKSGVLGDALMLPVGDGPVASIFHPSGKFLYVANAGSDSVSKFAVDTDSATLTKISGDSNAGIRPQAMLLSSDGRYLYMINSLSESLWTYAVDDASGDLKPFHSVRLGFVPLAIASKAGDSHLYVVGGVVKGRLLGFGVDSQSGKPKAMTRGRLDFGLGTLPVAAQVSVAGDSLFVALRSVGEIAIVALEPGMGEPSGDVRFSLGKNARPESLLLSANSKELFIAESSRNEVLTLALATPKSPSLSAVTPAVRTQDYPLSLAFGYGSTTTGSRSDNVFVANSVDGTMSSYAIDSKVPAGTGSTIEQPGSPLRTDNLPKALALHPGSEFLYAAGRVGISVFSFDKDVARWASQRGILVGDHVDLIMGRRGQFLYAVEGGSLSRIQPYRIRSNTGVLDKGDLKALSTGRFSAKGALDPTGRFVYVPNQGENSLSSFVVDVRTGQVLPLRKTPAGKGPSAVAVHPSGRWIYVTLAGAGEITQYLVDPLTGQPSTSAAFTQRVAPVGSSPVDVAIDPSGRWLYVADAARREITLFSVDLTRGSLTRVSSHSVFKVVQRLRVDASGRFLFVIYDNGTRGGLVTFVLHSATGEIGASSTTLTGGRPQSLVLDRTND